jgi:hypothetical protein
MKKHCIDLNSLTARGKAEMKFSDGILDVWTANSVTPYSLNLYGDSYKRHYIALPGHYRLPFSFISTFPRAVREFRSIQCFFIFKLYNVKDM